ncbi:hydroxysteroid dehydrogenase-like protein 2, partial [Saccoglossus kowalevskii]|uniref:Hydroxysteroid dehydrogenase-like protein 2-like n=1 Tax=Saccoglossus kowalevskii TaxID=10224 RepID=A0ABM0GV36_SACKO
MASRWKKKVGRPKTTWRRTVEKEKLGGWKNLRSGEEHNTDITGRQALCPYVPGVEDAGGKCLPCIVDVRNESQIQAAVDAAVNMFGGIDILINNASAINTTGTLYTDIKRYDLMMNINTRGTFLTSKLCLPHLLKGRNPHILNISPPLNMNPDWFKIHVAYTMAKYGMSMCVLGMAEEFRSDGIAVNALWPRTLIDTAAATFVGGKHISDHTRKPEIMADAAYLMLTKNSSRFTGNFCIDDDILRDAGITDLEQYAVKP